MSGEKQQYLQLMGIETWTRRQQPPLCHESTPVPVNESLHEPVNGEYEEDSTGLTVAQADWPQLRQSVSSCQACELSQTRTQTVFGVGDENADCLLIGEAPGADEDRMGEPFVGRAGQLLNEMLRAMGFQRQQVYIANILKCRPPNNRDPKPEEVVHCEAFLHRQVALIKPRIILALGRVAAQNLLKTDTPVGKLRKQQHQYQGIPLVVTYHPAYLLRSPLEKQKAWQDLLFAQSIVREQET